MSSNDRHAARYRWLLKVGERGLIREQIQERQMAPYKVREGEGAQASSFDLSAALNAWLRQHGGSVVQSCANCVNMRRDGPAFCGKYNITPPIDVITHGCPAYMDESDIPF